MYLSNIKVSEQSADGLLERSWTFACIGRSLKFDGYFVSRRRSRDHRFVCRATESWSASNPQIYTLPRSQVPMSADLEARARRASQLENADLIAVHLGVSRDSKPSRMADLCVSA